MAGLQREHEFSNDVNMLLIDAIQRLTRDKPVEHNDDGIPCSVQPSLPPSVLTRCCNISKVMRQTLHITELSVHVGRYKQTVAAGRASDLQALLEGSKHYCLFLNVAHRLV